MDPNLRSVYQDCLRVFSKSLAAKHFTCAKVSPPFLVHVVKTVHIDLDVFVVEGRGLHWFIPDVENLITLKFRSFEAITLPSGSVKVQFHRPGAEVVNVKLLDGGIIEILYRADGADALGLKITVCDQVVCQSTAQLGMSVETAMAEIDKMDYLESPHFVSSKYFSILLCWRENASVVATVLKTRHSCDFPLPAQVLFDIMRKHITEAEIQWRALSLLSGLLCIDRADEVVNVDGWDTCIYASMDAFPDDPNVQDYGCVCIIEMSWGSVSGKEVLRSGRALEVCRRATRLCPHVATDALEALE